MSNYNLTTTMELGQRDMKRHSILLPCPRIADIIAVCAEISSYGG